MKAAMATAGEGVASPLTDGGGHDGCSMERLQEFLDEGDG
jgi:hypothetical protein